MGLMDLDPNDMFHHRIQIPRRNPKSVLYYNGDNEISPLSRCKEETKRQMGRRELWFLSFCVLACN